MSRVVTESRVYDAHFDPTYTSSNIPSQTVAQDPRVSNALSQPDVVAGTARYKYFRRPVMPRLSAIPPQGEYCYILNFMKSFHVESKFE